MRLRYTPEAVRDLEDILAALAVSSPQGADRVRSNLRAAFERLIEHPKSGRLTDYPGLRRCVVKPYLVFYRITETHIVIAGVRHGARDPASMPKQ